MIDRRNLLLAAGAAATLPQGAFAQAPAAPSHRMMVGTLPVTIVQDGANVRPNAAEGFVVNATGEQVLAALAAAGTPGPAMANAFNQTVVQTRAGLVLIDVGFGRGAPAGTGNLAASMRAAGLDPAAITMVLFTHFHGDHIGGLIGADGTPTYANATIKVPAAEWAYWMDDGERSRATAARQPAFANARERFAPYAARVERFAANAEVAPGITAVPTPGHSPGHTSFLIADGSAQALVLGDSVTSAPIFMANPDWYPGFDMDPTMAVATRRAVLERAATERMPVIGYHFPLPATGRVERAGNGYRLLAPGA